MFIHQFFEYTGCNKAVLQILSLKILSKWPLYFQTVHIFQLKMAVFKMCMWLLHYMDWLPYYSLKFLVIHLNCKYQPVGLQSVLGEQTSAAEPLPIEYLLALCFSVPYRRPLLRACLTLHLGNMESWVVWRVFFLLCLKGYSEIAVKNANSSSSAVICEAQLQYWAQKLEPQELKKLQHMQPV